jgi:hypothetical protein
MERIVYRKTLDVHKNGVQFTLQGFETADKMSRRIEISLMAGGDTIDIPLEQIKAIMYVTTPNATEPSINECTIKDNKIIYDVLPIVEEGITEMQLKIIETSVEGAKSVLGTPRFCAEVTKSNADDEGAIQTTTFTALEDAVAKATEVYASRLLRIELDSDCMFRAYYADGNVYETDVLKELFLKGDVLLSQSYAKGGSGVRAGEDTDNSMYYSNVSKSASEDSKRMNEDTKDVLTEVRKHGMYTAFTVDFESGEVEYISPAYNFDINEETGELEAEGVTYSFEETVENIVNEWLRGYGADIEQLKSANAAQESNIQGNMNYIRTHDERIALQSNDIEELKSRVSGMQDSTTLHELNITDLQNDVEGINSTLTSMEMRINDGDRWNYDQLDAEISTRTSEDKRLSDKIDSESAARTGAIGNLENRMNSQESSVASLIQRVGVLEGKFIITSNSNASSLKNAPDGTVWIKPLSRGD